MHTVIIKRSEWLNGSVLMREGKVEGGLLLRDDNMKCCLGFYCLSKGIQPDEIIGIGEPSDIADIELAGSLMKELGKLETEDIEDDDGHVIDEKYIFNENSITISLMTLNDNTELSEEDREKVIHEEGLKTGIDFQFVD